MNEENKDILKNMADEIYKDYTDAKVVFDGLEMARVREMFRRNLVGKADFIRDDNGMIDFNFGCLCITITDVNGKAKVNEFVEVWNDSDLVASEFDCTVSLEKLIKEKLRENILFIQNVFHEEGGKVEVARIDEITTDSLALLDKITL